METLDITPDRNGMIGWARMVLEQSALNSKDAEVARTILAAYGEEVTE